MEYIELSVLGTLSTLIIGFLVTMLDYDFSIILKDNLIRRDSIYFHLFLITDGIILTCIANTKLSESICVVHALYALLKLIFYLVCLPYYN